jgi:hypothetical protein
VNRSALFCAVLCCVLFVCSVGVSSEPQYKQLELTPADKVMVLASDGAQGPVDAGLRVGEGLEREGRGGQWGLRE